MIVRSLPARFGDCLLVSWGSPPRAILIDAGLARTYAESLRPALAQCRSLGIRRLELVVITHIDRDHIGGIEQTLTLQHDHGLAVAEVWFNGEPQLPRAPALVVGVGLAEAAFVPHLVRQLDHIDMVVVMAPGPRQTLGGPMTRRLNRLCESTL